MGWPNVLLLPLIAVFLTMSPSAAPALQETEVIVEVGDTWAALAMRYNMDETELKALNVTMNTTREPAIGRQIRLPDEAIEHSGHLIRPAGGGLTAKSAELRMSTWSLALSNGLDSPYKPAFYKPLYLPGDGRITDLPLNMSALELSAIPALPGMALGLRGTVDPKDYQIVAELDGLPVSIQIDGERFIGVVGTSAFYRGGEPELFIQIGDNPAWAQPWVFASREWIYQQLTLTGEAAKIDQAARDEERARLKELWASATPYALWSESFRIPLDEYLEVTANYGARRSYNGGPYLTYHEGVDFSAYGGTPVLAAAAGTVVLAEPLYVRGGAVIIDHGLGIFTGYYHMSAIHAEVGQQVEPGDLLGEVGTTGLSTGNHLHWDLLINGVWVDGVMWRDTSMDCWLLDGLGRPCSGIPESE